jgi:hypothetical protein
MPRVIGGIGRDACRCSASSRTANNEYPVSTRE